MRNSSSSNLTARTRKGQFFVLTTLAVVTILFFVGRWVSPSNQPDTSYIVKSDELSTFDNIKEKASVVVKSSEDCNTLNYNAQEYKKFVDNFAKEKNYRIDFAYSISPCSDELGTIVEFTLRIQSDRADAKGTFFVVWP